MQARYINHYLTIYSELKPLKWFAFLWASTHPQPKGWGEWNRSQSVVGRMRLIQILGLERKIVSSPGPLPKVQILGLVCHAYDHRLLQIANGCLTLPDHSATVCASNKPLVSNSHSPRHNLKIANTRLRKVRIRRLLFFASAVLLLCQQTFLAQDKSAKIQEVLTLAHK